MAEVTNVFVTDEGEYGYSLDSPQVEGLAAGWATETEMRREYKQLLRDVGVSGDVVSHTQLRRETPEGVEYIIRWMSGKGEEERLHLVNQIEKLLHSARASDFLRPLEPSATGEYVLVACLADDTLGWLIDQLNPRGDVLVANLGVAGEMVAATQVSTEADVDWPTVEELGWKRSMTLSELLVSATKAGRPVAVHA
ncbi:hypothetical protein [Nocardioides campestrisoli]|uniref:hypothetical protein n=1 Tax=Nocardioides campestrisoli TaxID=2736757 RepID=UPI0015E78E93|nr:hypothetical protein [Nocardioides campestrisoli]